MLATFKLISLVLVILGCLSLLVYQIKTGVPSMPSSISEASEIIGLLRTIELPEGAIIYELGSGWGALASMLSDAFPHARVRGLEVSPLPYWVSCFRTRSRSGLTFIRRDFFTQDLTDADVIVCYLMTKSMPKLASLLDQQLMRGSHVAALAFWFRDREPILVSPSGTAALYAWPALKGGVSR